MSINKKTTKRYRCIVATCDFDKPTSVGTSVFPTSNLDIREKWARAAGLTLQDVKPSFRFCHRHFDPQLDFHQTSKKLRYDAVPSKFLVSSITTHIFNYSNPQCLKIFLNILFNFQSKTISYGDFQTM